MSGWLGVLYLLLDLAGKMAFGRRIKISEGLLPILYKYRRGSGTCCCEELRTVESMRTVVTASQIPELHIGTMVIFRQSFRITQRRLQASTCTYYDTQHISIPMTEVQQVMALQ
ncbi:hypothetical protein F5Y12DRAFT_745658 [Xylaria sp. FL1777]|nr:hypothetical protein F5Y12DRAFT_745658 [Xylaria sp. FL1777]